MIHEASQRSAFQSSDYVKSVVQRELNPRVFDWSELRPRVAIMFEGSIELTLEWEIRLSLLSGRGFGNEMWNQWMSENTTSNADRDRCSLSYGSLSGTAVCILRDYFRLTDGAPCPALRNQVRLQVETLLSLGVEALIVVSKVEPLSHAHFLRDEVVVIDRFSTLFAPDMPLYEGVYRKPDNALQQHCHRARSAVQRITARRRRMYGYAMIRGTLGGCDDALLGQSRASVVGMSMLPEAHIAALYGIPMIGLGFVTNTADEIHSHEENQRRAKELSGDLGKVLTALVEAVTKG